MFARLDEPIVLKDNMILNVGEAHIVINVHARDDSEDVAAGITGDDDPKGTKLKLKIFGGPTSGEIFYFKNEG